VVSSRFLKWKNTIKKSHFDYLFNFNKKNGSVAEYIVSATHWLSAKGFGGINEMNIFSLWFSARRPCCFVYSNNYTGDFWRTKALHRVDLFAEAAHETPGTLLL